MLKFKAPARRRVVAQLLAGALICSTSALAARAEAGAGAAYVISDQEGYGLLECLTHKADCGKIVADSWCAAHGHGAARAFGRADDVTGVIDAKAPRAAIEADAAVVACAE